MLLYLALGLFAGVLAGIFGIGGGIVLVPSLVLLAKMSQKMANGTSLGALLLPVGLLGAWAYWREGNVNVRAAAFIALGIFLGTYVGALGANALSDAVLRRAFSILLVAVAVRLWFAG